MILLRVPNSKQAVTYNEWLKLSLLYVKSYANFRILQLETQHKQQSSEELCYHEKSL